MNVPGKSKMDGSEPGQNGCNFVWVRLLEVERVWGLGWSLRESGVGQPDGRTGLAPGRAERAVDSHSLFVLRQSRDSLLGRPKYFNYAAGAPAR